MKKINLKRVSVLTAVCLLIGIVGILALPFTPKTVEKVEAAGVGLPIPIFDNVEDLAFTEALWTATGLWHRTDLDYYSPTHSWRYGIEGMTSFDTGVAHSGALTSRLISLPAVAADEIIELTFQTRWGTETGITFDKKLVQISTDQSVTWTNLLQVCEGTVGPAGWHHSPVIDLTSYAGQDVMIRFYFDTVDAVNNEGKGWLIDNIRIEKVVLPPVFLPEPPIVGVGLPIPIFDNVEDLAFTEALWTATGLWHRTDLDYYSPTHSWRYGIEGMTSFDTGVAHSGALTSRLISLPAVAADEIIELTFQTRWGTETGITFDKKLVQISTDQSVTWTNLLQVCEGTVGPAGWHHSPVIDLTSYAGQDVMIRFYFDTVDAVNNEGKGWLIDNIRIEKVVLPVEPVEMGNLVGCVRNQYGNPLIGVGVIATKNVLAGDLFFETTTTNQTGCWFIPEVPVGLYFVEVVAPGLGGDSAKVTVAPNVITIAPGFILPPIN